jgi:hypothetical protein
LSLEAPPAAAAAAAGGESRAHGPAGSSPAPRLRLLRLLLRCVGRGSPRPACRRRPRRRCIGLGLGCGARSRPTGAAPTRPTPAAAPPYKPRSTRRKRLKGKTSDTRGPKKGLEGRGREGERGEERGGYTAFPKRQLWACQLHRETQPFMLICHGRHELPGLHHFIIIPLSGTQAFKVVHLLAGLGVGRGDRLLREGRRPRQRLCERRRRRRR